MEYDNQNYTSVDPNKHLVWTQLKTHAKTRRNKGDVNELWFFAGNSLVMMKAKLG